MYGKIREELRKALDEMERTGLYKHERVILSPQGATLRVREPGTAGRDVLNFCSNNYLGLANHAEILRAASEAMERRGFGLSSVRFICGTQDIHKELEARISAFLGLDDALLYAACFDANGGVFEPLTDERDSIISDELNHASIIDGVRLSKAKRLRYHHADMNDLEANLRQAANDRRRVICTDGVFSMDGDIALLPEICELAERYDALVMVDDSHATGYIGANGRGTAEYRGTEGRVDIVTTTFGKALGGGSGGCVAGRTEIIELLRQRSRPYLFSNTLAPAIVGGTLKALELIEGSPEMRSRVHENARRFRTGIAKTGLEVLAGETAIVPVMVYDEPLALRMAEALLAEGMYVIGFAFPVVPRGKARIRVQLSAAHSFDDIDRAIDAFSRVGRRLGLI